MSRFDHTNVEKSLVFLRSAAVRLIIGGGINGTVEEEIFQIAAKVHQKEIKSASQLRSKMMRFVPSDQLFETLFLRIQRFKGIHC